MQTTGRLGPAGLNQIVDGGAAQLLDRHLRRAKEWFPHELVPWELGRRCPPGAAIPPADSILPQAAMSALFVNLLTEDNLPHYFHAIVSSFGSSTALCEWSRRWAAEEQRHATVIRDWLCVTRHLDLVHLERARMRQLTSGFDPGIRSQGLLDGLVYLAVQELATRISHWNTGRLLDDLGAAVMKRVAADENQHYLFYRDLVSVALEADPSATVAAVDRQISGFEMPGTLIEDFARHAHAIAGAGIYDLRIHYEQVVYPLVMSQWRIDQLEHLDAEAEEARTHLLGRVDRLRRVVDRLPDQRTPRSEADTVSSA